MLKKICIWHAGRLHFLLVLTYYLNTQVHTCTQFQQLDFVKGNEFYMYVLCNQWFHVDRYTDCYSLNKGRKGRSWSSGALNEEWKSGEGTAKPPHGLNKFCMTTICLNN